MGGGGREECDSDVEEETTQRDPGEEGGLTYRPTVRRLLAPRFSSLHTNKNQKGDDEPMCTKSRMSSRPETKQASTDSSCLSFTPDTCCKQTRPSVDMSPPSHSLTNPPASRRGNLYGNQRRQAVSAREAVSSESQLGRTPPPLQPPLRSPGLMSHTFHGRRRTVKVRLVD